MATLSACIKKHGQGLSDLEIDQLKASAKRYITQDAYGPEKANVAAVEDLIADLELEREDILKQAEKQGWVREKGPKEDELIILGPAEAEERIEKGPRDFLFKKGEKVHWWDSLHERLGTGVVMFHHDAESMSNVGLRDDRTGKPTSVEVGKIWHWKEEIPEAYKPKEAPRKEVPASDIGTPGKINVIGLAKALFPMVSSIGPIRNKVTLQGHVAKLFGITRTELLNTPGFLHKPIEEAYEYAIVLRARKIISDMKNKPRREVYGALKDLYQTQPNLATRTGTSIEAQAYSTPVHLAYLAQEFAGVDDSTWNYEPTGGTGMLVTKAEPAQTKVNELNDTRLEILKDQNFLTTQRDASADDGKNLGVFDAITANPPFGSMKTKEIQGYKISKLEHAIMMNALRKMKDDGKAAFIIGGHNFDGKDGEMIGVQRIFLNWLYHHYNVVANIEIPGSEYARQGASFPVRLIVVHGRKATPTGYAPEARDAYQAVNKIDDILSLLEDVKNGKNLVTGRAEAVPGRPARPGRRPGPSEGRPGEPGPLPGPLPGKGAEGGEEVPGARGRPGRRGGYIPPGEAGPEGRPPGPTEGGGRVERPVVGDVEVSPEAREPGRREGRPGEGEPGEPLPGEREGGPRRTGEPDVERVSGKRDALIDDLLGAFDEEVAKQEAAKKPAEQEDVKWTKAKIIPTREGVKAVPITEEPTAKQKAKETVDYVKKIAEGAKRINELLGQEGLAPSTWDKIPENDPTWQQIKAILREMLDATLEAGKSAMDFARLAAKELGAKARPYFERFIRTEPEFTTKKDQPKVEQTEYQSGYDPKSGGPVIDETLVPRKMKEAIATSLDRLAQKVGDIDQYVADKLQFKSKKQLYNALAADQIDAVALAIDNIDRGAGMVIGDQTGVGKGRVAAAIWKYARIQGKKPIFFTAKPTLFTDFYRDMVDIGYDFNPLIMASKETEGRVLSQDGKVARKVLPQAKRARIYQDIIESGPKALGQYDGVVVTYSQINTQNTQQKVLARLFKDNIIILDESHKAAGADSETGNFIRNMLQDVSGVVYLSATFAKRPETMPLYYKTDMSRANMDMEDLVHAVELGDTPLQEILANGLARLGQMVRREKSFKGIRVDTYTDSRNRDRDERRSDGMTATMRNIFALDVAISAAFSAAVARARGRGDKEGRSQTVWGIPIEGSQVVGEGQKISSTVNRANFSATAHNAVRQLLLAMKAEMAVEKAIAALREKSHVEQSPDGSYRIVNQDGTVISDGLTKELADMTVAPKGRKPFIALDHTMGSFMDYLIKEGEIRLNEPFEMSYGQVLQRHLSRVLQVQVQQASGHHQSYTIDIKHPEFPRNLREQYEQAKERLSNDVGDIPGSPIDFIKQKLVQAGYKVGEITGRPYAADLTNPDLPILVARTGSEIAAKKEILKAYNLGTIDAVIVNRSGAEGVSAHAHPDWFKVDPRPRIFLGAQAQLNVDDEVQLMGRINRKGQVALPVYQQLFLDIPGELRPASVLMRKLKSLSANTSANSDSPLSQKSLPDMDNKYGNRVVREWLANNPLMAALINVTPDDGFIKVSGRIAMQPVAIQREFFEDVEQEYLNLIEEHKEQGTYDLEVQDIDFKAVELGKDILVQGVDEAHPFGGSTFRERLDVENPTKPYTSKRLAELVEKKLEGRSADDVATEIVDRIESATRAFLAKRQAEMEDAGIRFDPAPVEEALDSAIGYFRQLPLRIGDEYQINLSDEFPIMRGVLLDVKTDTKRPGNPSALSKIRAVFAVNNSLRRVTVPFSKLASGRSNVQFWDNGIPDNWDEISSRGIRSTRYIVTGNLLQGFADVPEGSRIVRFTMADGKMREGILLPMAYDPSTAAGSVRVTPGQAFRAWREGNDLIGEDVQIEERQITVPRSRAAGGKYFMDPRLKGLLEAKDFETRGDRMRGTLSSETAVEAAIGRIYELGGGFSLPRTTFQTLFGQGEGATGETLMRLGEGDTAFEKALFAHYYVSPRDRVEMTEQDKKTRKLAYGVKSLDPEAVKEVARDMATKIPGDKSKAILIPIPAHTGDRTANFALAKEISRLTGARIQDVIRREAGPSQRDARVAGLRTLAPEEMKARTIRKIRDLKNIYFVDNVITSGATIRAAADALGGGIGLVYAKVKTPPATLFRGTEEEKPYGLTKKQARNAADVARYVYQFMRMAGAPKEVLDRIKIEAGPFIDLRGKDYEASINEWIASGLKSNEMFAATTIYDAHALVQVATSLTSLQELETTAYHEWYHIAKRWLMSKADAKAIENFFPGEEGRAGEAESFARFARTRRIEGVKGDVSALHRIWMKLRRYLQIIANGLKGKGWTRPEDIFGKLYVGAYGRPHFAAAEGAAVTRFEPGYAAPFYSQLESVLEKKLPNTGTAEQYLNLLRTWEQKGEFKGEEIKWSGLHEWLGELVNKRWHWDTKTGKQVDDKIPKQEVLDFVRANQVEIREVTRTHRLPPESQKVVDRAHDMMTRGGQISHYEYDRIFREELAKHPEAKFNRPDLVLPGGENYRELLLTLPIDQNKAAAARSARVKELIARREELKSQYERAKPGQERQNITRLIENTSRQIDTVMAERDEAQGFRGAHWPEPNVLAHVRFNDRTGPNGEKVLFLEEVQSDWHQQGREKGYETEDPKLRRFHQLDEIAKKGYFGPKESAEYDRLYDELWDKYREQVIAFDPNEESLSKYVRSLNLGVIPKAPFSKTWHELVLKRMLRYAAENGYDRIAWTTGEQQAERYDLSKQIKRVVAKKIDDNRTALWTEDKEGRMFHSQIVEQYPWAEWDQDDRSAIVPNDKLEDIVGKELAEKIINQTEKEHEYSGLDLKVGGEGMKGFYDKMLPAFLNKYGKKWGARVGEMQLDIEPDKFKYTYRRVPGKPNSWEVYNLETGAERTEFESVDEAMKYMKELNDAALKEAGHGIVHSIPITDSMKESVLYQGQTLFRLERDRWSFEGKPFSMGIVDMRDGVIEQVVPYSVAEESDWHHSMWIHKRLVDRHKDGEVAVFWLDNGVPVTMEGPLPSRIQGKIQEQIKPKIEKEWSEEHDPLAEMASIPGEPLEIFGDNEAFLSYTEDGEYYIERADGTKLLNPQTRQATFETPEEAKAAFELSGQKGRTFFRLDDPDAESKARAQAWIDAAMKSPESEQAKAIRENQEYWDSKNLIPEVQKDMKRLFKRIKEDKAKGRGWGLATERTDFHVIEKLLMSPEFMFEKIPAAKKVFEAALEKVDQAHSFYNRFTDQDRLMSSMTVLAKERPTEFKRLEEDIWQADMKQKTHTEESLRELGYSDQAIKAWKDYRQMMDNALDALLEEWRRIIDYAEANGLDIPEVVTSFGGKEIKVNLKVAMAIMGQMRGWYAPRNREPGRYMVSALKKGANPQLKYFDTHYFANRWAEELEAQGYTVKRTEKGKIPKTARIPEDVFLMAGRTLAINDMINTALEGLSRGREYTVEDFGLRGFMRKHGPGSQTYILTGPTNKQMNEVIKMLGGRFWPDKEHGGQKAWHFSQAPDDMEWRIARALNLSAGLPMLQESHLLFAHSLASEVSNIVRGRGFRSHMIARSGLRILKNEKTGKYYVYDRGKRIGGPYKSEAAAQEATGVGGDVWLGYDRNILSATSRYLVNLSNGMAKKEMMAKMVQAVSGTDIKPSDFKSYEDYLDAVQERRIDAKTQPQAYDVVTTYMQEMSRNDEFADRVIGFVKSLAVLKYLSMRLGSAFVNLTALVTSVPGAMHGYGNIPFHKVPVLLGKAMGNYYTYRWGDRASLKPEMVRIFDTIREKGWDEAQYTNEALQTLQSKFGSAYDRLSRLAMIVFSSSEHVNRVSSIAAAYMGVLEANPGMKLDEAANLAKHISDRSHGIYKKTSRPYLALGKNPFAQVAKMFYVFSKFPHNYLQTMYDLGFKKKDRVALMYMALSPAVLAGAGALALPPGVASGFMYVIGQILAALGDDRPEEGEERVYAWLEENLGTMTSDFARFGLVGLAGVNIKGSLKIGDIDSVPTTIWDMVGAPGSVVLDVYQGGRDIVKGDVYRGVEKIMPGGIRGPMAAIREYREGVTTSRNVPRLYRGEPMQPSFSDTVIRALTFNASNISKKKEQKWADEKVIAKYRDERAAIYSKLRAYYRIPEERRDYDRYASIMEDIREHNEHIERNRLYELEGLNYITKESIKTALRQKR